jgi:hypothetical protein
MRRTSLLAVLIVLALSAGSADAQIRLPGALGRAAGRVASSFNVGSLTERPPITTSLDDARWADPSRDGFTPAASARSLMELERTPNGGFVLRPGYWQLTVQSYCLKAGTYGPGGGDGYLYAPLRGPAEDAVMAIVRNSVQHPEIDQRDVQVLLWAIIARAKFEDLDARLKATAGRLLTPRQLAGLNRNALDLVPGDEMGALMNRVPGPLQQVVEAEANLRRMLTEPGATFEQMERAAVLAGVAPVGPGSRDIPSGRWSLHPDGYYVRYVPTGYTSTVVDVWVPEGSEAAGREFDPATHIAVPGNTARQRLIQSGREYRDG